MVVLGGSWQDKPLPPVVQLEAVKRLDFGPLRYYYLQDHMGTSFHYVKESIQVHIDLQRQVGAGNGDFLLEGVDVSSYPELDPPDHI